jgi:hypothetical protein
LDAREEEQFGTSQAEIADFLTTEPPIMEGHRGLEPTPVEPARTTVDVGLRDSVEAGRPRSKDSVSENVARSLGSPKSPKK